MFGRFLPWSTTCWNVNYGRSKEMVVCVYPSLNYVNQRQPTHHKQSTPPEFSLQMFEGERGESMIPISCWSPSLWLFSDMHALMCHPRSRDGLDHVWEGSPMFFYNISLPCTFIANQCRWHHFFFCCTMSPAVDGNYAMLFNCHH